MTLQIRNAEPEDHAYVSSVLDAWWGGRQVMQMLPKLFFVHFRDTSFVIEAEGQIAGFLCALFSQTYANQVYVHFLGVNPAFRKSGVGRALYERLFEVARANKRTEVHAVTSPVNQQSLRFHTQLGFELLQPDSDGVGEPRVHLFKRLDG